MSRVRGGIYKFKCPVHDCPAFEKFAWDRDVPAVTCACGQPAARVAADREIFHVMYSDTLGVMPSQVAEHRMLHPDIPLTNDGRVIITSAREHERICAKLGATPTR
jgi:hypothetical protein